MIIEPFILRRTKKEVLKELPDKTMIVLNNEMIEEQEKIYLSYLAQARNELNLDIKPFNYSNYSYGNPEEYTINDDYINFLEYNKRDTFEEECLEGLVLGYAKDNIHIMKILVF